LNNTSDLALLHRLVSIRGNDNIEQYEINYENNFNINGIHSGFSFLDRIENLSEISDDIPAIPDFRISDDIPDIKFSIRSKKRDPE
jgi:hypothetical protein